MKHRAVILLLCLFSCLLTPMDATRSTSLVPRFTQDWRRAYLATYPRSGNHWTRYLIEEASGIATSSIYVDRIPQHLKRKFPWGGYCPHRGYEGNRRYPKKSDIDLVFRELGERMQKYNYERP